MPIIRQVTALSAGPAMRNERSRRRVRSVFSEVAARFQVIAWAVLGGFAVVGHVVSHHHAESMSSPVERGGFGFVSTAAASLTPSLAAAVDAKLRSAGLPTRLATKVVPVVTLDGGSPFMGAARVSGDAAAVAGTSAVLFLMPPETHMPAKYVPISQSTVSASTTFVAGTTIDALLSNAHHQRRLQATPVNPAQLASAERIAANADAVNPIEEKPLLDRNNAVVGAAMLSGSAKALQQVGALRILDGHANVDDWTLTIFAPVPVVGVGDSSLPAGVGVQGYIMTRR